MNYLGLTDGQEIPEGYDKYIWISGRCLEGIAWSETNGVSFEIIPENWEMDAQIFQLTEYLQNVKDRVMEYAVEILNNYHHTSYGKREWNIMLSQWMNIYLASLYDKYLKLQTAEGRKEDCECNLYKGPDLVVPLDYMDYFDLLSYTDDFHIYQYSQLYHVMPSFSYIHKKEEKQYHKPPARFRPKTAGYWKTLVYRNVIRILKHIIRTKDRVVLQDSYLPQEFLLDVMGKKPGRITNYIVDYYRFERTKLAAKTDREWRRQEQKLPDMADDFAKIACRLLKRSIPLAYVEGFGWIQKTGQKIYKFAMEPDAVIYAAGGSYSDEVFKAYLMNIRRSCDRFCCIQHGGNYGIDALWGMRSEYEICDVFYTWGWRKKDSCCMYKPMPAAKLMNRTLRGVKKGNRILYVSYAYAKNIYRIDKRELLFHLDRQKEQCFFRGLPEEIRKKMIVRLYANDYGWKIRQNLEKEIPDLNYDKISDFYSSLHQAELVVLSEWSTTILEALCADKPVLVRRDWNGIEKEALDDLKELERVGVLVRTFEELQDQLERIYMDIHTWWNEPQRQKVVKRIRRKYAYLPEQSKKIWINEILGLAGEKRDSAMG